MSGPQQTRPKRRHGVTSDLVSLRKLNVCVGLPGTTPLSIENHPGRTWVAPVPASARYGGCMGHRHLVRAAVGHKIQQEEKQAEMMSMSHRTITAASYSANNQTSTYRLQVPFPVPSVFETTRTDPRTLETPRTDPGTLDRTFEFLSFGPT